MYVDIGNVISNNITKLDCIKKWYFLYQDNSKFNYSYYKIYENVTTIDVNSFNIVFLKYINRFLQESIIDDYIIYNSTLDKIKRVVSFGYLYREVSSHNINLSIYMIAVRNIIFSLFFKIINQSSKNILLHRINYDDIEFQSIINDIYVENFVHNNFLEHVKLKKIKHVVVLDKKDGVYYIGDDNKIIDIKYTNGWVNIPIYKTLLNEIIYFIFNKKMKLKELHEKMLEIIEYADNDDFFGYRDCQLSSRFKPTDMVPFHIKSLFISNIMSKFSRLLNL
jgi:hypothetical protein